MKHLLFLIGAALMGQPYNLTTVGAITFNSNGASGFSPGNYLEMPAGPLNNTCTTMEVWANPSNVSSWQWVLNNFNGTVPTHSLGFLTGGNIFGQIGSGVVNGHTLTTGTHQHLAVQQCSGTITIFVDGIQRGSTSSTGPFAANTIARIGMNLDSNEIWSGSFRHLTIWASARYTACGNGSTCFTPATSYTGTEGMKAYYPLTANGNDLAGALSGGTLANCVGLCLIGAAAGLYQLQKAPLYGECGTFSDIGAPVSGSGTAQFSDTSTTQSCYRVSVNSGAAFSTVAKAPPSLQRSY